MLRPVATRRRDERWGGSAKKPDQGRRRLMSNKQSGFRRFSILLVCAVALSFARVSAGDDEPAPERGEPRPPDILDLVQITAGAAEGGLTLEAVVRPVVDGEVELEVLSPAGLDFVSGIRSPRFRIRRGGATHRERLQVELSTRKPTVVRVRANLLKADGQTWLSMERELRFNQRPPDPSRRRIPIVRTAPDGSRRVEYMRRGQAERRGLLPDRPDQLGAAEQDRRAPPVPQPGGDLPPVQNVQE